MWRLSDRLPITLAVSCRALSGPININNDHSDAMSVRDAGWIQIYAENNQEAYDNYLQAMRIAETPDLPIMICQDGFITSTPLKTSSWGRREGGLCWRVYSRSTTC